MRVLSYNIHKGVGGSDRLYRLERVIEVINSINADFVCLQEVDFNVRRSHFHNQPQLIAQSMSSFSNIFQLNVPHREGGYGNLLLSRWPLHVHHHVSLQHRSRKPRGAQMAVVDSPEGKLVLVNFHLGLAETERRWQVRHLLGHKLLKNVSHLPTLITGDFNDWRNTLSRHTFRHHSFRQATAPTRRFRSFPAFFPLASLDKLFHRGAIHISHVHVLKNRLARQASDHLPLIADFNLHQDQKN